MLKKIPDANKRPDFIILSDAEQHVIKIIELKNPQINLEYDHLSQLYTYYHWFKKHYPKAQIEGYLIGRNTGNAVETQDPTIKIKNWTQICLESRKEYVTLLAAMLSGATEHADDSRVQSIFEFGGDETEELLKRIATSNSDLNDFFQNMDSKLNAK